MEELSLAARQQAQAQTIMMNMVAEYELELQQHGGPHREMAVDVPESFVARTKTPPRYPPPRHLTAPGTNGTAAGSKPVPPPRDHLRIEKDGRLVNRAPPPQLPARAAPTLTPAAVPVPPTITDPNRTPTRDQLESIRKFQVRFSIDAYNSPISHPHLHLEILHSCCASMRRNTKNVLADPETLAI